MAGKTKRVFYRGIADLQRARQHDYLKKTAGETAILMRELKALAENFDYIKQKDGMIPLLQVGAKRVDALERALADKLETMLDLREAVERELDQMQPHVALVMRLRYVEGMGWDELCDRAGYSRRAVFYIHKSALSAAAGAGD